MRPDAGAAAGPYGAEFEAPERIGTFRVVGVLGGGAMGRVFLGHDEAVGLAAVKVIRPEPAAEDRVRRRARRPAPVLVLHHQRLRQRVDVRAGHRERQVRLDLERELRRRDRFDQPLLTRLG
jgi:hypothetical protein